MTPPTVVVREATEADCPAVAAVLRAAFLPHRSRYPAEDFAAATPPASAVMARLQDGPVLVAERGAAIVGTVSLVRADGDALYIRSLAVEPAAGGSGVGRALLDEAVHRAEVAGLSRVELCTAPFLRRAVGLYEAAGFARYAISKTSSGMDVWSMRLELGRRRYAPPAGPGWQDDQWEQVCRLSASTRRPSAAGWSLLPLVRRKRSGSA